MGFFFFIIIVYIFIFIVVVHRRLMYGCMHQTRTDGNFVGVWEGHKRKDGSRQSSRIARTTLHLQQRPSNRNV